jgi:hypothetical protein
VTEPLQAGYGPDWRGLRPPEVGPFIDGNVFDNGVLDLGRVGRHVLPGGLEIIAI